MIIAGHRSLGSFCQNGRPDTDQRRKFSDGQGFTQNLLCSLKLLEISERAKVFGLDKER